VFGLFLEQQGRADQFSFGREADGIPVASWDWETWTYGVLRAAGRDAPAQH
jgi:hypothetical protein